MRIVKLITSPRALFAAAAAITAVDCAAAVTPYSWIRAGEGGSVFADSSGNNHPFNAAFSSLGGGNPAAVIVSTSAGGPLGPNSVTSSTATRWGFYNVANSGMWVQGPNNSVPSAELWSLPATNWVVEAWVLPVGTGAPLDRENSQFLSTGSGQFGGRPGGVAFRTQHNFEDDTVVARLDAIGATPAENFTIGDPVVLSRTRWTHLAAVNEDGVTTFYVNGVPSGAPSEDVSAPSGVPYIGSGGDTSNPFNGFLDEIRFSTFAPGAFEVADLLLLPPGPNIVSQPQSISVWNGGPAIFNVVTPIDDRISFQWKVDGANITGETEPELYIPSVASGDDGKVYTVQVSSGGTDIVSSNATLTVLPVKTEDNEFFRQSILDESSLLAFFPVDNDTGATIENVENAAGNGTVQGEVGFDGRIDRAYGVKALRFNESGDVSVPANPEYEFADGSGTIEALIYLDGGGNDPAPKNIFSVAGGEDAVYYQFQVSPDGNSLLYKSDTFEAAVTWVVTPSLLRRQAHVALVFDGGNVTAYVDGISLGTKPNPGFGTPGWNANIGSGGLDFDGLPMGPWIGTIDELAIYGDALSASTLAVHNSRFIFGTAVTAPTITSSPDGTWNLLAGGAPVFRVQASGTAPLSYQWKHNGNPIQNNPSATTPVLTLLDSTIASSGEYTVTVSNPIGEDTSDPFTVNFTAPPAGDEYASFVLADNPSAYWRLNEESGTALKDYAGGHDGVYSPEVQLGVPGAAGMSDTAAHFSGAENPVANATVPYSPNLNPAGAYSIEFWARPDRDGNIGRAVIGNQNRSTGRAGYAVYQGFNVSGWEAHLGYQESVIFLQGTTPPVAGRWDHVVVTWDGINASSLYVNGRLEASDTLAPTRPNLSVPFEIGSRSGNTIPYPGTIDEIAFYNHALTPEQVEQHFSIAWIPAEITQSPVATTGTEAGEVLLSVQATGYPLEFEWFKDGSPVDTTAQNPDGSAHYIGANTATLRITQLMLEDAGQFHVVVKNPLGDKTSTAVPLTVQNDTVPPGIAYVTATGQSNVVRVAFTKPVTSDSAGLAANYTFTGGITAEAVALTTSDRVVDVVTSGPLTPGTDYSLSVTGVRDTRLNGNLIAANNTPFKAYVKQDGILALDFYGGIPGNSVDELRFDPQYPFGMLTNLVLNRFSVESLGDNYGARVYGWVTPSESGDYTFFLRSDDASQLYISSDADAANVELIAYEDGCCDPFKEPSVDATETSLPRTLVGGQSYYIEAFVKEGGGGDFLQVAWRRAGDTTPAGNLQPIPAEFLSGFGPVAATEMAVTLNASGLPAITWTGSGQLQESTDLVTWEFVAGNPASGVVITPTPGSFKFYRVQE